MSSCFYIASDIPLQEVKNPHFRQMSMEEAISLGAEFPDYLTGSAIDRTQMVLWYDGKIPLGEADMSEYEEIDDDFSICPFEKEGEDFLTKKPYCAEISWGPGGSQCIKSRAVRIAEYIRNHLKHTGEVELWHIWLGESYPPPRVEKVQMNADELDGSVIEKIFAFHLPQPVSVYDAAVPKEWGIAGDELEAGTQYCYVIASSCLEYAD